MLRRVAVRGYRSLRDYVLEDLGQTNILVGPNNVGKSTLLRLFCSVLTPARQSSVKDSGIRKTDTWGQRGDPVTLDISVDAADLGVQKDDPLIDANRHVHSRL